MTRMFRSPIFLVAICLSAVAAISSFPALSIFNLDPVGAIVRLTDVIVSADVGLAIEGVMQSLVDATSLPRSFVGVTASCLLVAALTSLAAIAAPRSEVRSLAGSIAPASI